MPNVLILPRSADYSEEVWMEIREKAISILQSYFLDGVIPRNAVSDEDDEENESGYEDSRGRKSHVESTPESSSEQRMKLSIRASGNPKDLLKDGYVIALHARDSPALHVSRQRVPGGAWFLDTMSNVTRRDPAAQFLVAFKSKVAKCVEIGLPQLILLVVFSQYLPHIIHSDRHVFDRFAVLFSVTIIWIYAHLLTVGGAYKHAAPTTQLSCRTDKAGLVGGAPWIRIPYPFQFGAPTFNAGEAFAMMAASFVALVESTGTYIAVSRYSSATPLPPSVLSRGVGWQGVGILFSGLFGTVTGSTVSVENAGLLALTRVGSRRVVQISAGFMIFFSILGKFGAIFASIPAPIIAALYCLFFAYVGSSGLSFLQFCNLNSFRTKFILGFSFFMGLSVPQYFNEYTVINGYGPVHTGSRWFNDMINVLFSSEAFVAGFLALLMDSTLHSKESKKDRGMHWWKKFRSFRSDTRSEEFYSLPFNLNKFFPSV